MSEVCPSTCDSGAIRYEGGRAAALGAADWLRLAAAPIFVIMALLTGVGGGEHLLCSTGQNSWSIGGMVPMYLLMCLFHSGPWLTLIAHRC